MPLQRSQTTGPVSSPESFDGTSASRRPRALLLLLALVPLLVGGCLDLGITNPDGDTDDDDSDDIDDPAFHWPNHTGNAQPVFAAQLRFSIDSPPA